MGPHDPARVRDSGLVTRSESGDLLSEARCDPYGHPDRDLMRPRWEELFRGYDIRGRYPEQIDDAVAHLLGVAVAQAFPGPFIIGRDVRRESAQAAKAVEAGIRSTGRSSEYVGVVPTPMVAFLARHRSSFGLSVTPSHNVLGYVGLKGFTPSGRVFDSEWKEFRTTFERGFTSPGATGLPPRNRASGIERPQSLRPAYVEAYLRHVTKDLRTDQTLAVDCRGGATARIAPKALRRIGARVIEVTRGYSPNFFGKSPEPRPGDVGELGHRVRTEGANAGFAFDGDGDRCLVLDEKGQPMLPEVVGLLLHSIVTPPSESIVASADASRVLEKWVRTVRSRVGSRYVLRRMRQVGAQVGLEPSGHYYVRPYGSDSDGVLVACLVAHALGRNPDALTEWKRKVGPIHRGSFALDFGSSRETRSSFRSIVRSLGPRARRRPEGVYVDLPSGWCLIRCSNTQPSIRFTFEGATATAFRQVKAIAREVSRGVRSKVRH